MVQAVQRGNLTLAEAAEYLGVSRFTLRRWARYEGKVPFVRFGKKLLFAQRDLEAFQEKHRVPAREGEAR